MTLSLSDFALGPVAWSAWGVTACHATVSKTGAQVMLSRWASSDPLLARHTDPIWREQHVLDALDPSRSERYAGFWRDGAVSWGVVDDFGGTPLATSLDGTGRSLPEAIAIVTATALLLDRLHALKALHGTLLPESVLWCPDTKRVTLTDFGFVSMRGLPELPRPRVNALEFAMYQSPEATGRAGAYSDYRGDLYSLGALFYALLVGRPPFVGDNVLELQHAHMAKVPESPSSVADVPQQVARIAMRLLAKVPEARYRSGAGVAADLRRCAEDLSAGLPVGSFDPGLSDVPTQLAVSTRLYGREEEARRLQLARQRTINGERVTVAVVGTSGVGKTAFVSHVLGEVRDAHGFFGVGKFEASTTQRPLVGISGLLSDLLTQLLVLPEEQLIAWRKRLRDVLGKNIGLLRSLAPEIELVLAETIPPAELTMDDEASERLHRVCAGLLRLLAHESESVVCLLDDVQWIDDASITLMERLVQDDALGHVLFVVACRDDDLPADPALRSRLATLINGADDQLELLPLAATDVARLVHDTFEATEPEPARIAGLLQRKTGGNPFFVRQYIESLDDQGLLRFDATRSVWVCDIAAAEQLEVSDSVVVLLLDRIREYPIETRELLNSVACLGGEVFAQDVALATGTDDARCAELLTEPMRDGLIVSSTQGNAQRGAAYRFSHDKVWQAAYEIEASDRLAERHLEIGARLLAGAGGNGRRAFAVAEQLDRCPKDSRLPFEPAELASVYFKAAVEARNRAAMPAAQSYIRRAAGFIGVDGWERAYPLTFEVHQLYAEVEFQMGDHERSANLLETALRHARTAEERAELSAPLIRLLTLQDREAAAIDRGRIALAELGFDLPAGAYVEALDEQVVWLDQTDIEQRHDALRALPVTQSRRTRAILNILMYLVPPSYFVEPALNNLIAAMMARLSIEQGVSDASPKGFSNYGSALAERGRYREGYLFARLGLELAEAHGFERVKPRVMYSLAGGLNHWVNHLRTSRAIVDSGFEICVDYGERDYGGYLLTLGRCQNDIFLGANIEAFKLEVAEIREYVGTTDNGLGKRLAAAAFMALSHLDGSTADAATLDVDDLREDDLQSVARDKGQHLLGCYFNLLKAHNFCFLGDMERAAASIAEAESYRGGVAAQMTLPMLHLFSAFISARVLIEQCVAPNEQILASLEEECGQWATWRAECADNFAHCHELLCGALARLKANDFDAVQHFRAAAEQAARNGYVQFEGLAHLCCAEVWGTRGSVDYQRDHLLSALDAFTRWGARRVVERVLRELATLTTPDAVDAWREERERGSGNEALELRLLIDLSQDLSHEGDMQRLEAALRRAIIEVAGAQTVTLIAEANGTFNAADEAGAEHAVPIYPRTMVNLARRFRETVRYDSDSPLLTVQQDPYLLETRPRAALCIPLLVQGELEGVAYVENRISPMQVPDRRLRYLTVLATQAAICIRNSRLYRNLEQTVEVRTEELSALAQALETRVQEQVEELSRLGRLRQFLSPQVAELVLSSGHEEALRSHRRQIAILFCDLRGFTAFSESVEPEEAMAMLTGYQQTMGNLFREFDATIDHRAGDGIMVFLNDPIRCEDPARRAVALAVRMRDAANGFIEQWSHIGERLGFGVGITYGYATIGLMGDDGRMDYTATGRYVNLASRLCDLADDGQILVTERIHIEVEEDFDTRFVEAVELKGFARAQKVYDVRG